MYNLTSEQITDLLADDDFQNFIADAQEFYVQMRSVGMEHKLGLIALDENAVFIQKVGEDRIGYTITGMKDRLEYQIGEGFVADHVRRNRPALDTMSEMQV